MNSMKKEIIPMQNKKIKRLKKSGSLVLAAMMMILSSNITAMASSPQYVSEEGIGIDVYYPAGFRALSSIIEGDPVSGGGGTLWVTWKDGLFFRANYDHSTKEHRCSVTNDHLTVERSEWTQKGTTAISPWLDQTISNNRAYYSTR